MNDKYVPEKITKYYPIENLNSKENLLSDKNYANSIQDALLSASIEFEQGEEYKAHIDKMLFGKLNAAVSIRLKRVFQST